MPGSSPQTREERALPIIRSTTAVLDDLSSNKELLDPFDRSLGYEHELGVQLRHSSIDTTDLTPEESADRILNSLIMQDSGE